MPASHLKSAPPANELGPLLRHWRSVRGRSQLDLSLDAGVSQRHLSFIESGRSLPGRDLLISLAQTLDIPLRERNALFLAAGYAPVYSGSAWDAQEMKGIVKALRRILLQQEPFPAMVMDRYWNVLLTNDASPRFFNRFIDMSARAGPRNILHLMFDPQGMRPFVVNWERMAQSLLQRVGREALGRVVDDQTRELLAALLAYPEVKPAWQTPAGNGAAADLPMISMTFAFEGRHLSYFSMVTTVGTPQTVAAEELRIETLFPADEETEAYHLRHFS